MLENVHRSEKGPQLLGEIVNLLSYCFTLKDRMRLDFRLALLVF